MSKKEIDAMKKVMATPRSPLNDYSVPVRNMDEVYGKPGQPSGAIGIDPLAQLEREEAMEAYNELRELKARQKTLEMKRKIEVMKQEVGEIDVSGGGLKMAGLFNLSPEEIAELSKKPDAERQAIIDTMKQLGVIAGMAKSTGSRGGEANALLQYMAMGGFNRGGQQGMGLKDVMEMQRMWATIYEGAGRKDSELTNTLLLKLLTETLPATQTQANQNLQMAYQAQIANLQQNQSDPMRDIKAVKELAEELGLKQGNVSDQVALEIAKMNNMMAMKNWELRKDELQSRKTLGTIQQILGQINIPAITRNMMRRDVAGAMRGQPPQQLGQPIQPHVPTLQPEERIQPMTPPQMMDKAPMYSAPQPGQVRVLHYQCPYCGQDNAALDGTPQVTCVACGGAFNTMEAGR